MSKEDYIEFDNNYWEIKAWRASISLSMEMERVFSNLSGHHLLDDMLKTGLEISTQIAISFEEREQQLAVKYLGKAKRSCTNLRTRLFLAKEMLILNQNTAMKLIEKTREVATLISKSLEIISNPKNAQS